MCWPVDAIAGQARGYSELVVMHENAGKRVLVSMASVACGEQALTGRWEY